MLALPFFLALWFSPMLLFSTSLRDRKRRITIGDGLIGVAWLAVVFALLRTPEPTSLLGLSAVYVAPFVLAVLYMPRGWDVVMALIWSVGTLLALLALIVLIASTL